MPTSALRPLPPTDPIDPPALALTPTERRLVARLRTPAAVQAWLNALPYNTEVGGETLRSFRGVVSNGTAHCLEAALFAAVALEQHRYPPLVLSFESIDLLDHVIFVYRTSTGRGSVARSRDPGLHGRRPVFATPRALALSYFESYIDFTFTVSGTYYVAVSGGFNDGYNAVTGAGDVTSPSTGRYNLIAQDFQNRDGNDTIDTFEATLGKTDQYSDVISFDTDVDLFRIKVNAGDRIAFDTSNDLVLVSWPSCSVGCSR